MNRLAGILGFLAIVLKMTMGASAASLLCEHQSGIRHLVPISDHASESRSAACCDPVEVDFGAQRDYDTCSPCIDTELGNSQHPELLRSATGERVPAPQLLTLESMLCDAVDLREQLDALPLRGPLVALVGKRSLGSLIETVVLRL